MEMFIRMRINEHTFGWMDEGIVWMHDVDLHHHSPPQVLQPLPHILAGDLRVGCHNPGDELLPVLHCQVAILPQDVGSEVGGLVILLDHIDEAVHVLARHQANKS